MTPDQWEAVVESFEAALALSATERDAFLDTVGRRDARLRAQIEALLEGDRAADQESFLTSPSSPLARLVEGIGMEALPADFPDPDQIGPYRVVERLGAGGMGVVFLAEQISPIRRKVAVKVLRRGIRSVTAIARFEIESQALAAMEHPNISVVHDAGVTDDHRPYIVMEYIRGVPITEYCDAGRLDVRERLRLFLDVCAGVQHAHQKGVIHRDLKPSNILVTEVDGRPVPKVIDFGVARIADSEANVTSSHLSISPLFGTLEYMSPDQIQDPSQEPDTRADVYSLGVVLYQLLTGQLPHLPTSGALRGDLDWISAKALAREAHERYRSPAELAEDIRRHLANEPVSVAPSSRRYRVGRFCRRHRRSVIAGSLIVVSLAGSLAWSTASLVRAKHAEAEARQEALTSERVAAFMTSVFEVANPFQDHFSVGDAGERTTARELLDQGVARIEDELAAEPEVQSRLLQVMGESFMELGDLDRAATVLNRAATALDRARQIAISSEGADLLDARILASQGHLELHRQNFLACDSLCSEALRRWDQTGLADANRIETRNTLARAALSLGDLDRAEALARETLQVANTAQDSAGTLAALGQILIVENRFAEAAEAYELSRTIETKFRADEDPRRWSSGVLLAATYHRLNRMEEAESLLVRSIELAGRLEGDGKPAALIQAYNFLGNVRSSLGEYAEAAAVQERSISLADSVGGSISAALPMFLNNLSSTYQKPNGMTSRSSPFDARSSSRILVEIPRIRS